MQLSRSISLIVLLASSAVFGQDVIYQNNFDHHSSGVYTEAQLEADWNAPPWDDGVREGRVQIVEGAAAFGGSGSAMAVSYPAGEHGTKETGAQWKFFLDESYEELSVSYRVRFRNGFDFVRGGKLPGLAGGSAPSGSAPADGIRGWTGRLMWRTDFTGTSGSPVQPITDGISYAKHLDSGFDADGRQEDQAYWLDPTGDRTVMESGVWYQIKQRIKMNTPGQADGILQIWLDDLLVLDQSNIRFRSVADLQIDQLFFSTFFGGGSSWRTSKDEVVYFDDFLITAPAPDEPEEAPEPRFLKVPRDYPTIQTALDDANDGDTIAVSGEHTANVVIDKSVIFRGYTGTVLTSADPELPAFTLAADDIVLKRIEIVGGSCAVLVELGSKNVSIDAITSEDTDKGLLASGCDNISVHRSDFTSSDGDGVTVTNCNGVELWRVESSDNDGAGFVLTDNEDLLVERCRAWRNHQNGFVVTGDSAELLENLAVGGAAAGFVITSNDHEVIDNEARHNKGDGFQFERSDDSYITENLSRYNDGNAFAWDNCDYNTIFDNVSQTNDGHGFLFESCHNSLIDSNFADKSGLNGFFLDDGTKSSTVIDNRSNENDGYGFVDDGTGNSFSGNNCRGNGEGESSPAGLCD